MVIIGVLAEEEVNYYFMHYFFNVTTDLFSFKLIGVLECMTFSKKLTDFLGVCSLARNFENLGCRGKLTLS